MRTALAFALALGLLAAPAAARGPLIRGTFRLTDAASGRTVTERSYAGKRRLVFFGFTHCPLTCPLGLRTLDRLLAALGPRADGWQALFITIDPRRDDAPALRAYLQGHDPRITGLTGTSAAVAEAMRSFRLEAQRVGEGDNYLLEHPALIFVMDAQDRYLGTLPSQGEPEVLLKQLLALASPARP